MQYSKSQQATNLRAAIRMARRAMQIAKKNIDLYQAMKQCAGSMSTYTFFHEKQAQAIEELAHWQSFIEGVDQCASVRVGSLVKPRTSAAKGVVLATGTQQGQPYAKVQTIGHHSYTCRYLISDLQVVPPDDYDIHFIRQANLPFQL